MCVGLKRYEITFAYLPIPILFQRLADINLRLFFQSLLRDGDGIRRPTDRHGHALATSVNNSVLRGNPSPHQLQPPPVIRSPLIRERCPLGTESILDRSQIGSVNIQLDSYERTG